MLSADFPSVSKITIVVAPDTVNFVHLLHIIAQQVFSRPVAEITARPEAVNVDYTPVIKLKHKKTLPGRQRFFTIPGRKKQASPSFPDGLCGTPQGILLPSS